MNHSSTRLIVLGCLITVSAWAGDDAFSGRVVLTLDNALAQFFKDNSSKPKPLELHVTCEHGQWVGAWGYARDFNTGIHLGTATGDMTKLRVKLDVERDNWIDGGNAEYEISLKRTGDRVEGIFTGTFTTSAGKVWEAKDKVSGYCLPPNPVRAGFVPVQPGEHPRCLFRQSELPALRARAETPFGKAMVAQLKTSNDPVHLGFLYQLTGDKAYAARAFPETVKVINNRNGGAFALGRFWGYRTSVVGAAYDLCYDAWTVDQREQVENYLDEIIDMCLNRKHRVGTVNWTPGSNYTVVIHPGNGIAALALWGEKCRAPAEPPAPNREVVRLKPDATFHPGKGVPIVPLPVGMTATEWLWVGPFNLHYTAGDDCLASSGGMAAARPAVGTRVKFKSQEIAWQPLSKKENPDLFVTSADGPAGYGLAVGQIAIRTPQLAGGEQKRLFFYNVVEVAQAGYYKFKANFWNGTCYIAGQRLLDGEIAWLDAGRYPWLVPVVLGAPTGHASPQFAAVTEADATAFYRDTQRYETYEQARANWQKSLADWRANGGVNQTWLRNVRTLTAWNYLVLQSGMGDGGFQGEGEGYTLECHHVAHDFACVYQNVMGQSVTGRPDISHFAARYIHDVLWNGTKPFQLSYGGHGGGTIPADYLARSIVLAPAAWQPVILDHWLKLAGVTREQVLSGAGATKLCSTETFPLLWTFLNYPLELKPHGAEGVLPRVWESKARGYYSFRNGWKGDDDILASSYAKQGLPCGWNQNEAGTFQIYGLANTWVFHDPDASGKTGSRWLDNIVMLPEDPINAGGRGVVTHFAADQNTGSGVVTFNLDDVYRAAEKVATPTGITGIRSFAADYTGKAGVPGLFALVDKITGGGKKIWILQKPKDAQVAIAGNTITFSKGAASLKATFLAPANVKIEDVPGKFAAHPASGIQDVESTAIHATGPDGKAGEFFVVFTLQRGAAPAVQVQGAGLGARATVGKQTVRFDGANIVLEK